MKQRQGDKKKNGVSRDQLKELTDRLEKGVMDFFTSENYQHFLDVMSRFHHYSVNNTILIALQNPLATQVASYATWKKMGRQVRRGEKGIKILVPTPVKIRKETEKTDPATGLVVIGSDGKPVMEESEYTLNHFKIGHVFSLEQTDGEPLPEVGIHELTESYEGYERFMDAVREIATVPIRFDEIEGGAKGYYNTEKKEIVIQEGMSQSQTMKTAVHELAHSVVHDREKMQAEGEKKDRLVMETEAESIAYCVCSFFHLDTSDYSWPYISSYSSSRELKELRSSMETIRSTSGKIIDELQAKLFPEMSQEKETDISTETQVRKSVAEQLQENRIIADALPRSPSGGRQREPVL